MWLFLIALLSGAATPTAPEEAEDILSKAFPAPDYQKLPLIQPLISALKTGETVELRIATTHCNGGSVYSLRVRGPVPVEILVRGEATVAADPDALPVIGMVTLNADEALRLDRVLAFYRAGTPAWNCTASSRITASWTLASGPKNESWVDQSCSVTETEASLPLWAIVDRAAKKP